MGGSAVLALDVGGTTVKGAAVDETGRRLLQVAVPTFPADGAPVLEVAARTLEQLADRSRELGVGLAAAGVVTPGVVDGDTGHVAFASNLGWRDLGLRDRLEDRLRIPVAVGHDVRAAGAAEGLLGAGHGARDLAFIALGTGISAALVTAGQVVTGVGSAAGEVGHMPVYPQGRTCACGQRGCLEMYASGVAVARRYRELADADGGSAELIAAALGTDPVADAVWAEAVEALALGASTITMMLDPQLIVLGGGLARSGERLLAPLRSALAGLLTWRRPPELAASELGSVAGQVGAAMLAFSSVGMEAVIDHWTTAAVLAGVAGR